MKEKICLFAGTSEGRKLAAALAAEYELFICVATEYGEVLLDGIEGADVHTGRMDETEMECFFDGHGFARIIDATHPFAAEATKNIRAASAAKGIPYLRVLRENEARRDNAVYLNSVREAAEYLEKTTGNVLVTTGSKELGAYSPLGAERVWARVLPSEDSISACLEAGVPVSHIIAAQGPFTKEFNTALIKMTGAKYIVTKDSGKAGGFEEKLAAAEETGAAAIVIGRPTEPEGLPTEAALDLLLGGGRAKKAGIFIIGVGPAGKETLTFEARDAAEGCDAVFGAKPVADMFDTAKPKYYEYSPEKICEILSAHPGIRKAAVLMRGDTGFYSGAKRFEKVFRGHEITVLPGVSSVAAFAARLGVSWEDARLISLHGRNANAVHAVKTCKKTFVLTGGENTVASVCRRLCLYGLGEVSVAAGEKLGYPEERITRGTAKELCEYCADALSVLYIYNPEAESFYYSGLPDGLFVRGDTPMTKSEVRAVTLSKLAPKSDSVIWDVGAGTGSVSVECALNAPEGRIYAIEKDESACELINLNARKFGTENIITVCGEAPECLHNLESPDIVFIGGSAGGSEGIIAAALEKNPRARIVINCVTLETLSDAVRCREKFAPGGFEAVAINAARSKQAGNYNLMSANNPVYIITMQKGENDV